MIPTIGKKWWEAESMGEAAAIRQSQPDTYQVRSRRGKEVTNAIYVAHAMFIQDGCLILSQMVGFNHLLPPPLGPFVFEPMRAWGKGEWFEVWRVTAETENLVGSAAGPEEA